MRDETRHAEQIARVTRRLRPARVEGALQWLNEHVVWVDPPELPRGLPETERAIIGLFHWLEEVHVRGLEKPSSLWSSLSTAGFAALVACRPVDQQVQVVHPAIGRYEGHRRGRLLLIRRVYPDDRVHVAAHVHADPRTAHTWLGSQADRIRRQIPPEYPNLPGAPTERDLPGWLVGAIRHTPRAFPGFVDARLVPPLVRRGSGEALSPGAVAGVLKELYRLGYAPLRGRHERALYCRVPGELRDFLTPESGEALAAWLLDAWGEHGGYAATRWCTLALRVWPSLDNTRRLGRVIDQLRSRLNSAGVRYGVQLLEIIGDDAALALLARFARHGSYAQSRDANAAIVEAARTRGRDRAAIDELAPLGMDDFDVDDRGVITIGFDERVTAEIDVTDLERLRPRWRVEDRVLKRAPRGLKAANPETTERLDRLLRQLHRDVRREVTRLEAGLMELRGRPWSSWRVYFQHRLLRHYVRGLVWHVPDPRGARDGSPNGAWVCAVADPRGAPVFRELGGRRCDLDDETEVRLVHPADLGEDALCVWRDRLIELDRSQPFAQLDRRTYRGDDRVWLDFAGVWHDHLEHGIGPHLVSFHDEGRVSLRLPHGLSLVGRWRPSRARHWAVRAVRDGGLPPGPLPGVETPPPDAMPAEFVDPFAVWVDRLHFVHDGRPLAGREVPPRLFSEVNLAIRRWDVGDQAPR